MDRQKLYAYLIYRAIEGDDIIEEFDALATADGYIDEDGFWIEDECEC
jgi:hypothetical protein